MGGAKIAVVHVDGAEAAEGDTEFAAVPGSRKLHGKCATNLKTLGELGVGRTKIAARHVEFT